MQSIVQPGLSVFQGFQSGDWGILLKGLKSIWMPSPDDESLLEKVKAADGVQQIEHLDPEDHAKRSLTESPILR